MVMWIITPNHHGYVFYGLYMHPDITPRRYAPPALLRATL